VLPAVIRISCQLVSKRFTVYIENQTPFNVYYESRLSDQTSEGPSVALPFGRSVIAFGTHRLPIIQINYDAEHRETYWLLSDGRSLQPGDNITIFLNPDNSIGATLNEDSLRVEAGTWDKTPEGKPIRFGWAANP
jgi:hypothetical protein